VKALLKEVRGFFPRIESGCFLAENAVIIGDVEIAAKSSIWFHATLRGDVAPIRIGHEVNVQDGCVIHGTFEKDGKNFGVTLEDRVTIGHSVVLHGCHIGKGSLVGMGSIVMDGVKIGEHCLIGAGSLVTEGSQFPAGSLIVGRPAKVKRSLTAEEIDLLEQSADNYLLYSSWYDNMA
jgi:carbonic anhydrase/acetyltransferase-like protein (isoleucine patch superfamily)